MTPNGRALIRHIHERSSTSKNVLSLDRGVDRQVRLMNERGYVVGNLDATLIIQKPKLSPHKVRPITELAPSVATWLGEHPAESVCIAGGASVRRESQGKDA